MNYEKAVFYVKEIQKVVTHSICINTIPYAYIFQLLNEGYTTDKIKNVTEQYYQLKTD